MEPGSLKRKASCRRACLADESPVGAASSSAGGRFSMGAGVASSDARGGGGGGGRGGGGGGRGGVAGAPAAVGGTSSRPGSAARPVTPNASLPTAETVAAQLSRSKSSQTLMALRPLRSVGKFSSALDPSRLSQWQLRTLQRTQPDAPLTRCANSYHGVLATSASSPNLSGSGIRCAASAPMEARSQRCAHSSTAFHDDDSDDGASTIAGAGGAEAAAYLSEAEHYHMNGSAGSILDRSGRSSRRTLGSVDASTLREVQPLSRLGSRLQPRPGCSEPLARHEFTDQLVSKLQDVPGVPMQILRLMRRGDWRYRAR